MTEAEWLVATDPRPMLQHLRGVEPDSHGIFDESEAAAKKRLISDRKGRLFASACSRRAWDVLDENLLFQLPGYPLSARRSPSGPPSECPADTLRGAIEVLEGSADQPVPREEFEPIHEYVRDTQVAFTNYTLQHTRQWSTEASTRAEENLRNRSLALGAAVTGLEQLFRMASMAGTVFPHLPPLVVQLSCAVAFRDTAIRIESAECDPQENVNQSQVLRDIVGHPFRPALAIDPACLAWNGGTVRTLAGEAYENRSLPSGHLDPTRLALLSDALEDAGCTDADLLAHLRSPGPHVRGCWALDLVLGKE
jgi:hypothetical protein